ncbi:MAG: AAA family ATPase [Methylobacter sp.]|nr:AAA family ATPase [Candidatus Methylobacter titanis]
MAIAVTSRYQPLYMESLGFDKIPFPVTPNPERYYAPLRLLAHVDEILHFLEIRKGFLLVTGDVGIGKTTLVRKIIKELDHSKVSIALLFNTFLQGSALIESINQDLGIQSKKPGLIHQLEALNNFLLAEFSKGKNCIIIIDDAQNLSIESLELVRQLSNLETNEDKLIQILLVAQPEILTTLARPEIRQLRSRIALHCKLKPFSQQEVSDYIDRCLTVTGQPVGIQLTGAALRLITQYSGGYPRIINLLMDRCLYGLLAYKRRTISASLVREAAKDLSLLPQKKRNRVKITSVIALCGLLLGGYLLLPTLSTMLAKRVLITAVAEPAPASAPSQKWQRFLAAYGLDHYLQAFPLPNVDAINRLRHRLLQETDIKLALISTAAATTCAGLPVFEWRDGLKLVLYRSPISGSPLAFSTPSEDTRIVQHVLVAEGLLAATAADGIMGQWTQQALSAFQQRSGRVMTGQMDDGTAYDLSCASRPDDL